MGVTYKLNDTIIQFIIAQRKGNPLLSCRELAQAVKLQFSVDVSKSSVHEVLKGAQIPSFRGRKPGSVFTIPLQKKEVISADLSKALAPLLPQLPPTEPPLSIPITTPPMQELPKEEAMPAPLIAPAVPLVTDFLKRPAQIFKMSYKPLIREEITVGAGEIFWKASFWDLCPQGVLGVKSFEEAAAINNGALQGQWEYLTTLISACKINLEDGGYYFVDLRDGRISAESNKMASSVPIEKALKIVADVILNNIKPLIIKSAGDGAGLDRAFEGFLASFLAFPGKRIQKIEIVGQNNHVYADFTSLVDYKRHFIAKISSEVDEYSVIIPPESPVGTEEKYNIPLKGESAGQRQLRIIKAEKGILMTNLPTAFTPAQLLKIYQQRYPEACVLAEEQPAGLDGRPLANSELPVAAGLMDRIKARADVIFPSLSREELEQISSWGGRREYNEDVLHVTISPPAAYGNKDNLLKAIGVLNNLRIEDEQGRSVAAFLD